MRTLFPALLVACLLGSQAKACGVFFGTSVLEAREATLTAFWDASFDLEAPRIGLPPKGLSWTSYTNAQGDYLPAEEQAPDLRLRLLGAEAAAAWERWIAGDDRAFDTLPEVIRPYARAARGWKDMGPEAALGMFLEAAGPKATRDRPWPLLAAFMHAKMLAELERWPAAAAAYDAVVRRSRAGEADPLSLGARALSEAAAARMASGSAVEAVALLVEQAALGVSNAPLSLKWTLEDAMRRDENILALVADDRTRDALILYALAHFPRPGDSWGTWSLKRHKLSWSQVDALDEAARAALPPPLTLQEAMALIDRGLAEVPEDAIRGADRLAALLYRQGRYEDAARFARRSQAPIAQWIRAKLAVRAGQLDEAREAYRKAAAAFPVSEHWNPDTYGTDVARMPHCRIKAESAILALRSGDYADSLLLFLAAGAVYWHDAAYVAERVLTLDELLGVVRDLDSVEVPPLAVDLEPGISFADLESNARAGHLVEDPKSSLRHLTARRLMRIGRHADAIALFEDAEHQSYATTFKNALAAAEGATGVTRAQALFEAATIARRRGLEILSYESSPDWAVHEGALSSPGPLEKTLGLPIDDEDWSGWGPGDDTRWITDAERERARRHYHPPEPRFSYRLTAAQLANAAADNLPRDSQAFAAVLCHATKWLLNREPELARVYYRRYLAETKPVSWHASFGEECPAPSWPTS